jgi:penicillin-binding protein 2A
MQSALENVYKNDQLFPNGSADQLVQSGAVLLNPKTGGVEALVGGRGGHVFRGFNHATQLRRQPGSTMKPLSVYTPALEQGFDIYDDLQDVPVNFDGYTPTNYDGQYRGQVTVYDALIHSYNVPAVWLLNKIGLDKGIESVKRFGIPLTKNDESLSLALGGLDSGVSPLQMASAYSAYPNKGVRVEDHAITKIIDNDADVIAMWHEQKTQVMTEKVANKMIYMMKGVIQDGTGKNANIIGRELAGKTGSTQVPIAGVNGTKDIWFVGYTPQLVGSVWLGYDKTDENHYLQISSAQAALIFKEVMTEALKGLPVERFDLPQYKHDQIPNHQNTEKNQNHFINHMHRGNKKEDKNKGKEKHHGNGMHKENKK